MYVCVVVCRCEERPRNPEMGDSEKWIEGSEVRGGKHYASGGGMDV